MNMVLSYLNIHILQPQKIQETMKQIEQDPRVSLPSGEVIDLRNFNSERHVLREVLTPVFQTLLRKNPYKPDRRLSEEERVLFYTRLLVKKWFSTEHKSSLIASHEDSAEGMTSDWIDSAEASTAQLVTGTVLNNNKVLLASIERALFRCEAKTYGIGSDQKLIDLERLWVVPHSSVSINDKYRRN